MLTNSQIILVANFTQALLYGIYLATLIQCFRWLIFIDEGWKPRQKINIVMAFATIFIFLMSTINLVTSVKFEINEYIRTEYWYKYGTVMAMDISGDLVVISIDGVLIYRCWAVYGKSWRVICVPVTVWLASLACLVLQSYYAGRELLDYSLKARILDALISLRAYTGLYACSIAITVYSTTAIIYRILSSGRNSGGNYKRLNYVMRILAESGALYTSMMLFSLVGVILGARKDGTWVDWFIDGFSNTMAFSMGGISFNLLLIRVYQSRVELRNSFQSPDSTNDYELSGNQFNNLQISPSNEGQSTLVSIALDEAVNEIQEHHRLSCDGMRDN